MKIKHRKFQSKGKPLAITLLLLFFIFISFNPIWGVKLKINGFWNLDVDYTDLSGEGGSDFNNEFLSTENMVTLSVDQKDSKNWELDVRKIDLNWHNELHLFVRRSSEGVGDPTKSGITGGTLFLDILDSESLFMTGWGRRNSIGLQFKLTGLTASLPADPYTTTIVYTALDMF